MKKSTIIPFLSLLILLFSCQSDDMPSLTENETTEKSDELDEMSIFHLPSEWTTQHNEKIEFKDFRGQPLVVVMIYTACRTACPRLVADMRHIEQKASSKTSQPVKYVLVSIDPANDTPEKLTQFAKDNGMDGDQWIFLQGSEDGVRDFANILAVKYKKISPIDFSHSNIISVFDEEGVLKYQKEGLGLENEEIVSRIAALGK
ncbi:SCO family protein [Negadavirga shengliensis]|uniref:SCO family protein n=1 Tax=Negadavirga shengliensis TaxID=1389218 RepID=A0ABV9SZI1_9BACT